MDFGRVLSAMMRLCVVMCAILGGLEAVYTGGLRRSDVRKSVQQKHVTFMASLHDSGEYFCGGAIVSDRFILTSAECLKNKDPKNLVIRVGSVFVNKSGVTFGAVSKVIHPKYDEKLKDYNVGLVKTDDEIQFQTGEISFIPLASRIPDEGSVVMIAGWGAMHEGGDLSPNLRVARVRVLGEERCHRRYRGVFDITPRMFCSVKRNEGACTGDNGGPAFYKSVLIGVISHRVGCNSWRHPDVYSSLADCYIRNFVLRVMNKP